MCSSGKLIFKTIYPSCCRILGNSPWGRVLASIDPDTDPALFPDQLYELQKTIDLPRFAVDLAHIELSIHRVKQADPIDLSELEDVTTLTVNPTLDLIPVSHRNLPTLIVSNASGKKTEIFNTEKLYILVWLAPNTGKVHFREAEDADLLALKIAMENIDPREAAATGGVNIKKVTAVIRHAVSQGIIFSPTSLLQRSNLLSCDASSGLDEFLTTNTFTLQWHITQACDLHCKHCYDRSERSPLPYEKALAIVCDFKAFCEKMHVDGQITFTGGNPLLYPHFLNIYSKAAEHGFATAILGNPSQIQHIEELCEIQEPAFFQISLEGLEVHNDLIRGVGHFQRSLTFLDQLRERGIYSMVMLTLTRDNLDQVIPLGDLLRDRADHFTFNRLSTVGEGAQLQMVNPEKFRKFLEEYETETYRNPILGLKDNLFNILRIQNNSCLLGGCTGYGCGAAFNFISLLPDGEVHACRKFPSPIGNILQGTLVDIYQSELAKKYRTGSDECKNCKLNRVCRGCLAIAHSHGLDVFQNKDPFCFSPPEYINNQ